MPYFDIASINDPRLGPYRNLKRSNATRWTDLFVAEGMKLVDRLIDARLDISSLLLSERYLQRYVERVDADVDIFVVPDQWIAQIIGFSFHRGILAAARRRKPVLLNDMSKPSGPLRLVICPDVQNPENLGAILRLSAAFGINGLMLGFECCDPYSRRVLRVSMGATFVIPLGYATDVAKMISELQDNFAVEAWATTLGADAQPLSTANAPERLALVFGSEGHGLAAEVVQVCRKKVMIPMTPGVDSLNVAIAAGIFLYETRKQL